MQQQRSCRRRGIPLFSVLSLLHFALLWLCALPHIQASPLKPFPFIVLHGLLPHFSYNHMIFQIFKIPSSPPIVELHIFLCRVGKSFFKFFSASCLSFRFSFVLLLPLMMIDFLSRTYLIPWRFVYAPFFHASFSDLVLHFLRFRVFFFFAFPIACVFCLMFDLLYSFSYTAFYVWISAPYACLVFFVSESVLFVPSRLPFVFFFLNFLISFLRIRTCIRSFRLEAKF